MYITLSFEPKRGNKMDHYDVARVLQKIADKIKSYSNGFENTLQIKFVVTDQNEEHIGECTYHPDL